MQVEKTNGIGIIPNPVLIQNNTGVQNDLSASSSGTPSVTPTNDQHDPASNAALLRRATSFIRNSSYLFALPEKYRYEMFEGNGVLNSNGGFVVLVTGPFGGGKNALINNAIKDAGNHIQQVVEHTSRGKRPLETEGVEYFFVTREEFQRMAGNDEILVWGDLTGNFYGFAVDKIQAALDMQKVPILIQGPNNVGPMKNALEKRGIPTLVAFISPLSKKELNKDDGVDRAVRILEERMQGTERNRLAERSAISRAMFESLPEGVHVINNSNGNLEQATIDFLSLIQAKKEELVTERIQERFGTIHEAMAEFERTGKINDGFFKKYNFNSHGKIAIIISGPSGVGKGTILEDVFSDNSFNIGKALSYTTRTPRPNEKDGVDYFFISAEEFEKRLENNDLYEYVMVVNGKYYAHSFSQIQEMFNEEKDTIFDVDIKGTNFYRYIFKRMGVPYIDIFISPISKEALTKPNFLDEALAILEYRLRNRGSDESEAQIQGRLRIAREYLEAAPSFTHIIENPDGRLDKAKKEFKELISVKKIEVDQALNP